MGTACLICFLAKHLAATKTMCELELFKQLLQTSQRANTKTFYECDRTLYHRIYILNTFTFSLHAVPKNSTKSPRQLRDVK